MYLMSDALDVMAYELYAMCLVWITYVSSNELLYSCSDNIHDLVCGSRPPFYTSFLL